MDDKQNRENPTKQSTISFTTEFIYGKSGTYCNACGIQPIWRVCESQPMPCGSLQALKPNRQRISKEARLTTKLN